MVEPSSDPGVAELTKGSGSSFYWAMRLLPAAQRDAMFAIYAFCRSVDDIADGDARPDEKRESLDAWQAEIDHVFENRAETAVGAALAPLVGPYGLAAEDFAAIVDGMRMDAVARLRIADMDELALYCDRVACAVGRLSVRVFGLEPDLGRDLAKALGEALQLTNILRDVDEDAARDHVYVPASLLSARGIEIADPAAIVADPGFPSTCEELAGIARRRFAEAGALIQRCNPKVVRPAVAMMEVYRRHFDRLVARGWMPPRRPVGLSKPQKLLIAFGAAVGWPFRPPKSD